MAGYSKRSLVEKLGIKPGHRLLLLHAPHNYLERLGKLPDGVLTAESREGPLDFIQFFTTARRELEAQFPRLKQSLSQKGMLWVSWPKAASKVETDLTEGVVREVALRHGLVDVKVCAVDEVWSGLKLVYRLKDRT